MDADDIILGLLIGIVLAVPISLFFFKPLSPQTTYIGVTKPKTVVYENIEEWEIIRNRDTGRTEGVRVKRTAKEA